MSTRSEVGLANHLANFRNVLSSNLLLWVELSPLAFLWCKMVRSGNLSNCGLASFLGVTSRTLLSLFSTSRWKESLSSSIKRVFEEHVTWVLIFSDRSILSSILVFLTARQVSHHRYLTLIRSGRPLYQSHFRKVVVVASGSRAATVRQGIRTPSQKQISKVENQNSKN